MDKYANDGVSAVLVEGHQIDIDVRVVGGPYAADVADRDAVLPTPGHQMLTATGRRFIIRAT